MLICAKIVGHKPDHLLLSQSSITAELCYYTIDLAMPRRKPKSSPAEKESSSEPGRSHLQEEERKQSAVDAVKDSPDGASFSGQSDPEQPPPTVKRLKEENESERELPIKKKPRGKPKVEPKEELETKMAKKEEAYPAEESGGELPIKKKAKGKQKVEPKEELMEKKMAKEEETHPAEESGGELPIKKKAKGKQKVEPKEELMEKKMAKEEETHPAEESGGELPIKKKAKGKQKGEAKEELMEKEESHLAVTQKAATQKATMRKGKGKGVTKLPDQEHGEEGDVVEPLPQKQFWLMKSEPESRMQKGVNVKFSIEDLQNEPDQTTCWDGVRSYPGRNIMRDKMQVGDLAFFYHSNCKEPGIVGIMEVVREGYVDPTQFDQSDPHFDPKSKPEEPKWFAVDVKFVRLLKRFVSLAELRPLFREHNKTGGALAGMALFTQGRLSVQPVTKEQFDFILSLEAEKP